MMGAFAREQEHAYTWNNQGPPGPEGLGAENGEAGECGGQTFGQRLEQSKPVNRFKSIRLAI